MKSLVLPPSSFQPARHLHLLDERADPYLNYCATESEAQCSVCGAVYKEGSWQWIEPSVDATAIRCPACRRMEEQAPAAYLEIEGKLIGQRKDEILDTVRDIERLEKSKDPLQRIMSIESMEKGLLITTTDVRLARSIAQLLQSSYQCELDFHYDRNRSLLWLRCYGRSGKT
ncbi:MAG: BCAM0308 family protein [Burkholderiaceae bacterium]